MVQAPFTRGMEHNLSSNAMQNTSGMDHACTMHPYHSVLGVLLVLAVGLDRSSCLLAIGKRHIHNEWKGSRLFFQQQKDTYIYMCKHTYIEVTFFKKSPRKRNCVDTRYGIVVDSHHGQQVLELVVKGNGIQDVVNLVLPSSPELGSRPRTS
jgi:hypothetical protein